MAFTFTRHWIGLVDKLDFLLLFFSLYLMCNSVVVENSCQDVWGWYRSTLIALLLSGCHLECVCLFCFLKETLNILKSNSTMQQCFQCGVTFYIQKHRAQHFPANMISKMLSFKMNVNVLYSHGENNFFATIIPKCCLCECSLDHTCLFFFIVVLAREV